MKRVDRRDSRQKVATLKVALSCDDYANKLLCERTYVRGHVVTVCKDVREPIRCNKCQLFGHMRAACKNDERCALCASSTHGTEDCDRSNNHSCVSCGPLSAHSSTSRDCPAFKSKCEELDGRFPENRMPYFPTDAAWTWASVPQKLSNSRPPHHPRIDHDAGAPPDAPLPPARQSQLTDFLVPNKSGSQRDRRHQGNRSRANSDISQ